MTAPHSIATLRTTQRRTARGVGAAAFALPIAVLLAAGPASAAPAHADPAHADRAPAGSVRADSSDGVVVTNTETVQARLDATGKLQEARVYDQLSLTGHGKASIANPVSAHGLRNLDGFGRYSVKDGVLTTDVTVDGASRLRTVSDYTKDLPLGLSVVYTLNGKTVSPGAVVGRSGTLEVRYTVTNLTSREDAVSYDDGTGTTATATAETVVPMIGQLTTTLPSTFTDVTSGEASIAGDGRGGTRMTFQMTLFPPIGSATAEFGYTAQVHRGVVPPATLTALPVSPLTSPSFKGGSASYASGAQSGVDLTAGAIEIDSNLLALRDGAASLLDGLIQLRDGAAELSTGLNDEAAPGAATLAAGLRTANAGAVALAGGAAQVNDGASQLATGSTQLADGLTSAGSKVPALLGGLTQVDGGLAKIDAGLAQLSGSVSLLPTKAQALHDGIAAMRAGIGDKTTAGTLINGVEQLRTLVAGVTPALGALAEGATSTNPATPGGKEKLLGAAAALNGLAAVETDPTIAASLSGIATQLTAAADGMQTMSDTLLHLQGLLSTQGAPGLMALECGISSATLPGVCDPARPGLLEGLGSVDGGLTQLTSTVVGSVTGAIGTATDTQANQTLRGGVSSARAGLGQISGGGQSLVSGLSQLAAGATSLQSGTGRLTAGTSQLAAGSQSLTTGTQKLAAGATDLAAGLETAASGSSTLADGLVEAADGAPQLVDGASQLSEQGTSVLVTNGKETAADYGVKYAVIEAGAERAADEGMAYGAPEGAAGATAYSIEISGVDGAGAKNLGRGLASVALFGIGGLVAALAKRRFV